MKIPFGGQITFLWFFFSFSFKIVKTLKMLILVEEGMGMVCFNGKREGGDCRIMNVWYESDECPNSDVYIGKTSKSWYLRDLDHTKNYRSTKQDSPLFRHTATDKMVAGRYVLRIWRPFWKFIFFMPFFWAESNKISQLKKHVL